MAEGGGFKAGVFLGAALAATGATVTSLLYGYVNSSRSPVGKGNRQDGEPPATPNHTCTPQGGSGGSSGSSSSASNRRISPGDIHERERSQSGSGNRSVPRRLRQSSGSSNGSDGAVHSFRGSLETDDNSSFPPGGMEPRPKTAARLGSQSTQVLVEMWDVSGIAVMVTDSGGAILYASPALLSLVGMSEEAVVTLGSAALIHHTQTPRHNRGAGGGSGDARSGTLQRWSTTTNVLHNVPKPSRPRSRSSMSKAALRGSRSVGSEGGSALPMPANAPPAVAAASGGGGVGSVAAAERRTSVNGVSASVGGGIRGREDSVDSQGLVTGRHSTSSSVGSPGLGPLPAPAKVKRSLSVVDGHVFDNNQGEYAHSYRATMTEHSGNVLGVKVVESILPFPFRGEHFAVVSYITPVDTQLELRDMVSSARSTIFPGSATNPGHPMASTSSPHIKVHNVPAGSNRYHSWSNSPTGLKELRNRSMEHLHVGRSGSGLASPGAPGSPSDHCSSQPGSRTQSIRASGSAVSLLRLEEDAHHHHHHHHNNQHQQQQQNQQPHIGGAVNGYKMGSAMSTTITTPQSPRGGSTASSRAGSSSAAGDSSGNQPSTGARGGQILMQQQEFGPALAERHSIDESMTFAGHSVPAGRLALEHPLAPILSVSMPSLMALPSDLPPSRYLRRLRLAHEEVAKAAKAEGAVALRPGEGGVLVLAGTDHVDTDATRVLLRVAARLRVYAGETPLLETADGSCTATKGGHRNSTSEAMMISRSAKQVQLTLPGGLPIAISERSTSSTDPEDAVPSDGESSRSGSDDDGDGSGGDGGSGSESGSAVEAAAGTGGPATAVARDSSGKIMGARPVFHMGLHVGPVVLGDLATADGSEPHIVVMGSTVDNARLISQSAGAGQVLVSAATLPYLEDELADYTLRESPGHSSFGVRVFLVLPSSGEDDVVGSLRTASLAYLDVDMDAMVSPAAIKARLPRKVVDDLLTWDFDSSPLSVDEGIDVLMLLFHASGLLVPELGIDAVILRRFLIEVSETYVDVPYHNFMHSVDVSQSVLLCMELCRDASGRCPLTLVQRLALFVSAICHDLGHQGLNNRYHTISNSSLALQYNYRSVLEQLHCSHAFRLLTRADSDFLSMAPQQVRAEVRSLIAPVILATDMAFHASFVNRAGEERQSIRDYCDAMCSGVAPAGDHARNAELLELTMALLMKIADISNIARPFKLARTWGERLQAEWLMQGDLEKDQGLPVLGFMDRVMHPSLPMGQHGFIRNCGLPFLEALEMLFPRFHERKATAENNLACWSKLADVTEWDEKAQRLVVAESVKGTEQEAEIAALLNV